MLKSFILKSYLIFIILFVNSINANRRLFNAIQKGNVESIDGLLKADNNRINQRFDGLTPLMYALKISSNVEIISKLLEFNPLMNSQDEKNNTALMCAVSAPINENSLKNVQLLLNFGADPNMKNKDNQTALSLLAYYNENSQFYADVKNLLEMWINQNLYFKRFVKSLVHNPDVAQEEEKASCVIQ